MCLKSGMEKMLRSRACCSGLQGDYICYSVYCIQLELVGEGAYVHFVLVHAGSYERAIAECASVLAWACFC